MSPSIEELTDLRYLESRAAGGDLRCLADEFISAAASVPATDERAHLVAPLERTIKDNVDFLSRHPGALFQCLWNGCWWDGSEIREKLEEWLTGNTGGEADQVWLRSLLPPHASRQEAVITAAAFARDGKLLVTGDSSGTILVWDVDRGSVVERLAGEGRGPSAMALSASGMLLVEGNTELNVWNVALGRVVSRFVMSRAPLRMRFSDDGARLLTVSPIEWASQIAQRVSESDLVEHVWDFEKMLMRGHASPVAVSRSCCVDHRAYCGGDVHTSELEADRRYSLAWGKGELVLKDEATEEAVAWFPGVEPDVLLDAKAIAASPDGATWAVGSRTDLHLLRVDRM